MDDSDNIKDKNVAVLIHLSTISKYFIPFGNFIFPLLLWMGFKGQSAFVDRHGTQAINFQLSTFLYAILISILTLPFLIWQVLAVASNHNDIFHIESHFDQLTDFNEITGFLVILLTYGTLMLGLFCLDLFCAISAAAQANKGLDYKYPLTIQFIKSNPIVQDTMASA